MKTLFISLFPVILLCAALTMDATAQNSTLSPPSADFIGWDASKSKSSDVAINAIIQDVVPNHASAIPAGLHLMLSTPQGVLNASVGPYLTPDIQASVNRWPTGPGSGSGQGHS